LFPLFATSVVDTGPPVSLTNLLPVSMTPVVAPVAKFTASVVDTGGKFATDEVETGDKFADDRRQSVVYTSGAPLLANISEFLKNSK
jgi:hypothetical protein